MRCEKCKCTSLNNSRNPASRRCEGSLFSQVRCTHPLICLFSLTLPSSVRSKTPLNATQHLPHWHYVVGVHFVRTEAAQRRDSLRDEASLEKNIPSQLFNTSARSLVSCNAARPGDLSSAGVGGEVDVRGHHVQKNKTKYSGKSLRRHKIRIADATVCTSIPLNSAPRSLPLSLLVMIDMKSVPLYRVYRGTCQK